MSRANGIVEFKDGFRMYCLYDGTADMMYSSCYKSPECAWEMYRNRCLDRHSNYPYCSGVLEDVTVTTDYGSGFSWESTACRECMTIEGPTEPPYYE